MSERSGSDREGSEGAAADLGAAWGTLLQAYAGATAGKGNPFGMPMLPMGAFAQPFMYPAPLFYGGVPAIHPYAMGSDAKLAPGDGDGSQDEEPSDDEEGGAEPEASTAPPLPIRRTKSESRAASQLGGKRRSSGAGLGVKSQSSAALSLLATAAANKPPVATPPAATAAAQQAAANELWGSAALGGSQQAGGVSAQELSRMASDAQMQQLLASGSLDEREAKRLRRKQSNRESARRSRLRKQAECEALARQVKDLIQENSRLKEEKLHLAAQVEILTAKLNMASALHLSIGQGELERIQADLRAQQSQEAANMAAAMAQVSAALNGGALGKGGSDSQGTSDDGGGGGGGGRGGGGKRRG